MTTPLSSSSGLADRSVRPERFLDLVAPKLHLVEEELARRFVSDVRTVREVGAHILQGGGKRLRPVLLLLTSQMLGYRGSKDVTFATVIELIHTATLVHDDVIDEAAVRRGRSSINFQWGNHLTVLVGDYLYTHSIDMGLAEGNIDVLRLLSGVTIRMTEGEILGLEQLGRADVSREEYFDVVGRKTAALFGAGCRIPAILADAPDSAGISLFDYGFNLGVCFQLIDDILDFTSTTEVLGKPAVSDLKEGKLTLPLILALPRATDAERGMVARVASERTFGDIDPAAILSMVQRYGTVDQCRVIAREYADRALGALRQFPSSPAREALEFAVEFVQSRDR
ncbi:MAG: polyprenyl synthetase family protein [Acidobacteriota bacterium]